MVIPVVKSVFGYRAPVLSSAPFCECTYSKSLEVCSQRRRKYRKIEFLGPTLVLNAPFLTMDSDSPGNVTSDKPIKSKIDCYAIRREGREVGHWRDSQTARHDIDMFHSLYT